MVGEYDNESDAREKMLDYVIGIHRYPFWHLNSRFKVVKWSSNHTMSPKQIKNAIDFLRLNREDIVEKTILTNRTIDKNIETLKQELLFLTKDDPNAAMDVMGTNTIFIDKIYDINIMVARIEAEQRNRAHAESIE
ncbi:MAG: hypothetical protein ISN29_05010 [Gammaproteobacteria bacterium AqS3]|nr:hypothetical protein [Gammaproteobacteria bacterium AqS3]